MESPWGKKAVMENEKVFHKTIMEFVGVATLDFWAWQFIGGI